MFDIVEAVHKALRIESTWAFVLIIGIGAGLVGAFFAWVVDTGYKNSSEYKEVHQAMADNGVPSGSPSNGNPHGAQPEPRIDQQKPASSEPTKKTEEKSEHPIGAPHGQAPVPAPASQPLPADAPQQKSPTLSEDGRDARSEFADLVTPVTETDREWQREIRALLVPPQPTPRTMGPPIPIPPDYDLKLSDRIEETDRTFTAQWKRAKPRIEKAINDAVVWMRRSPQGLTENRLGKLTGPCDDAIRRADKEMVYSDIAARNIDLDRFSGLSQCLIGFSAALREYPMSPP